jgi:hypothetical protein
MSRKTKVIILGSVLLSLGIYIFASHRAGRIINTCRTLSPGITKAELVNALGSPISAREHDGILYLAFPTSLILTGASAPVSASVGRDSRVIELRCGDEHRN